MPQDPNTPTSPQATQPVAQQPIAAQNPTRIETSPPPPQEPLIIQPQTDTIAPPIITTQTNQAPPPSSLYPKSTRKIFLVTILALFFLTLATFGGALVVAYNNYKLFTPPLAIKNALDNIIAISPLPKPTRLIIESTFAKTATIKSADVKTEFALTTSSSASPVEGVRLTLEGPTQFDESDSKASEVEIGLEVKFEGATFSGAASVKTAGDKVYFKINEFPFGQIYQQLLSYKDKWYYWDIPEEYKEKDDDKEISQNMNKLISEFVKKSEAWTTLTSKDGTLYEMEIKPPKEEVTNLIYDIVQAYEPKDQDKLTISLEKEQITKGMEKVNDLKILIKVNKDTYYLQNISMQFNLSVDDFSLPVQAESLLPQEKIVFNFNLTTELSNYNKQVVIIPPTDAINIETTMQELSKSYGKFLQPEEPQASPSPSPEDKQPPEATPGSALRSLISPEETILGEKYNWEQELFRLFSNIIK